MQGASSKLAGFALLALVMGLAVLTFVGGLDGQFVWDDGLLISGNAYVHDFDHLEQVLTGSFWNPSNETYGVSEVYRQVYRPVVTLAFTVQWVVFGGDPAGFHAVSLGLHLLCVVVVWLLLWRRVQPAIGALVGATAGALLFALHPSRVESVAWASGSTELWMGVFVLLGYLAWRQRVRHVAFVPLAAVLFCLALLSKETAVVVPAILLVEGFTSETRFATKPWLTVTAVMGACLCFRFWMVPLRSGGGAFSLLDSARRCAGSIGYYVQMSLWPWEPSAQRAFRYETCSGVLPFPPDTLVIGTAVIVVLVAVLLRFRTKLREHPWLADVAWFLLPLAPVANVFDLHGQVLVAERFLYLPLFGLGALTARGVAWATRRGTTVRLAVLAASFATVLASVIVSRAHVERFGNTRLMWDYHYSIDPDNPQALLYLTAFRYGEGRTEEALELVRSGYRGAIERCNRSLALRFALVGASQIMSSAPDTDQPTLRALRAMYDGVAEGGDLDLETNVLQIKFGIPAKATDQVVADVEYFALPRAISWMRTLDLDGAAAQLEAILKTHPNDANAWSLLTLVHARRGAWTDAERAVARGLQRLSSSGVLESRARLLAHAREVAERPAADEREKMLRDAQIQVVLGAPEAARRLIAPALKKAPTDLAVVAAFARTMVADRRFDAAEQAVLRARALDPDRAPMWSHLLESIRAARPSAQRRVQPEAPGT